MKKSTKNSNDLSDKNRDIEIKSNFLIEGERLDDLQYKGLYLIQNKNLYCFSSDSVLLCNFVKAKKTDIIVDLCSGSGVVGILAKAKTGAKKLVMIEKQKELADMCERSLMLNNFNNAHIFCCDVLDAPNIIQKNLGINQVDVVCANPPYYLPTQKKLSGNEKIDIAKFELILSLNSLCSTANKLLKFGGKFYMVNDSDRIVEIISTLKQNNLEPKVIEFVFTKTAEKSNVVLIEAVKGGKSGAKVYYKNI